METRKAPLGISRFDRITCRVLHYSNTVPHSTLTALAERAMSEQLRDLQREAYPAKTTS